MSGTTAIEWTDATWNCVRGCSRVSEGCRHCYAERVAARFSGLGQPYHGLARRAGDVYQLPNGDHRSQAEAGWTGVVRLVPDHLADPLRWRKPRRIFVNSMSDLFHESLSNEEIASVFGVMTACPQHTFQVLTKRAKRMRAWFEWVRSPSEESLTMRQRGLVSAPNTARALLDAAYEYLGRARKPELDAEWHSARVEADAWPPPNVWLGVSVENQAAADERVPELLATPAAVRFLSCEPLLAPVDLGVWMMRPVDHISVLTGESTRASSGLGWIISGCESGPGARPCDVAWLRSLRDQCAAAGVPFFLKQAVGETARCDNPPPDNCGQVVRYQVVSERTAIASCGCTIEGGEACDPPPIAEGDGSKRKAGGVIGAPYLDGKQHLAFPKVTP